MGGSTNACCPERQKTGEPNIRRMPPTFENVEVTLARPAGEQEMATAERFGIRLTDRDDTGWQFVRSSAGLELCAPGAEGPMRLEVCAGQGRIGRRLRSVGTAGPLPRAIGVGRKKKLPRVFDATAGLCRDAMSLAHLGCSVTAAERVPALAMFAFLAVADAGLDDRLTVVLGDAAELLGAALEPPDVVFLDPMFSAPGRAQVKKEMQICRALAGGPTDAEALFAAARAAAIDRVVVKRHPHHAPLAAGATFTVDSARVRFDVYLAASPSA